MIRINKNHVNLVNPVSKTPLKAANYLEVLFMKNLSKKLIGVLTSILVWIPAVVWAGGPKAAELVVVADTRRLTGVQHYFANLYNENILLFAIWAVILTAALGSGLGFLMDVIMEHTGLDLKSRKIVEH
jgi:hypothetical protein